MNPAYSGMTVAALVVLCLIVIVLGLLLIKAYWPNSKIAAEVGQAETFAKGVEARVVSDIRQAEPTIRADIMKFELGVDKTLSSMLAAVEKRLLDTSGEDAAIAAAQTYLARVTAEVQANVQAANDAKAAKLAALQAHVVTLSAATANASVSSS